MNSERFKKAMSTLPTGVTVVTTSYNGKLFGFTSSSFTSVSLLPPLVSFCINKDSSCANALISSDYFAVSILTETQVDISVHFSKYKADKFTDIPYTIGMHSKSPLITDATTHIECRKYTQYQAGDHTIVIGEVINTKVEDNLKPLIYYLRQYRELK